MAAYMVCVYLQYLNSALPRSWAHKKEVGLTRGHGNPLYCQTLAPRNITLAWWGPSTRSTFTFIELEGPSIAKLDFYSP